MNEHLYAVIMAGGVGTRLWPRSRRGLPKQFLDLRGPNSLLQDTVDRILPLIAHERILVVVGKQHEEAVHLQVPSLPPENVILEPGPRGTAPCIGLAAVVLQQRDPAATMAVLPSDHCIVDAPGFRQAISAAAQIAQDDYLVTLGIAPSQPHTGYGYIQRGASLGVVDGQTAFRVLRFTEKPDADSARDFVDSGEFFWNGGIFVWRAKTILAEIGRLLPELHDELQAVAGAWDSPVRGETLARAWARVPRTTVDYGVMEKANRVAVLPVDIGWDDAGDWATLAALMDADEAGNVVHGPGRHILVDTAGSYVYASSGRLVAAVGLDDLVIVDTPDALLVCSRDQAQEVRDVVDYLKANGLEEYL